MKADFHIHSSASWDSVLKPETIVKMAKFKKLGAIAITDHETASAWKYMERICKGIIFVKGQEVKTRDEKGGHTGEIIGLFLNEELEIGTIGEVIDQIKDQDGVVMVPHPYDRMRKGVGDELFAWEEDIDAIEVLNGRAYFKRYNDEAMKKARRLDVSLMAGSDAHFPGEVGVAYTEFPGAKNEEDLRKCIRNKTTVPRGKRSSILYHAYSVLPMWNLMRER